MRLFVGLGNPGAKYAHHRHNIGFAVVDEIARRHGFAPWRRRFQGETSEGTLDRDKVVLLRPATFMNESGRAVQEADRESGRADKRSFFKMARTELLHRQPGLLGSADFGAAREKSQRELLQADDAVPTAGELHGCSAAERPEPGDDVVDRFAHRVPAEASPK